MVTQVQPRLCQLSQGSPDSLTQPLQMSDHPRVTEGKPGSEILCAHTMQEFCPPKRGEGHSAPHSVWYHSNPRLWILLTLAPALGEASKQSYKQPQHKPYEKYLHRNAHTLRLQTTGYLPKMMEYSRVYLFLLNGSNIPPEKWVLELHNWG